MVFFLRFMFYFAFLYCRYFIDVWFVVDLLQRAHSLSCCGILSVWGDSDRQSGSDQSNISNYGRQDVEELKS